MALKCIIFSDSIKKGSNFKKYFGAKIFLGEKTRFEKKLSQKTEEFWTSHDFSQILELNPPQMSSACSGMMQLSIFKRI